MKRLISTIFLTLFAIATLSISAAALTAYDRQELSHVNALADQNPGFESGAVKWSCSPALTINSNAASQFVPGSKQFATWDSNASAQECCSSLVKVSESGNCAVSLTYKVPSGTATHKIVAKDGSKDLAGEDVVSSTAAWRHDVEFPCAAAASNQARVCLRSVASNEPAIQLDGGYAGEARNVGVANLITESTAFTPTGSLTTNATYTGRRWRVGDRFHAEMTVSFSGTNTQGELTFNLPSDVVIDTSKLTLGTSASNYSIGSEGQVVDSGSNQYFIFPYYKTTTTIGVRYRRVSTAGTPGLQDGPNVDTSANAPITIASGDSFTVKVDLPVVGWPASQVVMPDAQGWYAAGNISGANPSLGVGNVSTFTEITSASLTLTPKSGSAPVGIMCSGTNAAATPSTSSTTCSAGSESIGFNVSVPRSGAYEICFHFAHNMSSNSNAAGVTTFQVIRTPTNSQTISEEGGGKTHSGNAGGSTAGTGSVAFMSRTACGNFNLSAGINGFRLMYEQNVGATPPATSDVVADADASAGQRDIYFLMKPISQQQQAILANSVSTGRTNGDKIGSARLDCDSASTIKSNPQGMVSTISNISSGTCSLVLATGYFSAAPICTVSWDGSGGSSSDFYSVCSSATACDVGGGGAVTTAQINMTCIGPR